MASSSHITDVFVRVRPSLDQEASTLPDLVLNSNEDSEQSLNETFPALKGNLPIDGFAGILGLEENNKRVFSRVVLPRLDTVLTGGTLSLFCYGYTGAGKTHTTIGYNGEDGLFRLAAEEVLREINDTNVNLAEGEEPYILNASAIEIYNDEVYDLFGGKAKCTLRKNKHGQLQVRGTTKKCVFPEEEAMANGFDFSIVTNKLSTFQVASSKDLDAIQNMVDKFRKVGSSSEHNNSSRSHAVFRLDIVNQRLLDTIDELEKIESIKPALQTAFDKKRTYALRHRILDVEKQIDDANKRINKMHANATQKNSLFGGRLILVDLAGADSDSRSIGDDGHTMIERKESQAINKSLLALKECIRALTTSSQHNSSIARKAIPFRNSSLTRILEEVLTPDGKRSCW
eukprot:CAMPEP_0178934084 /NCGR_PEP_ID=MMETSP0786-20121207/23673_1 /TAXON_ID=186022 /ORGANISM="Thalassionema frauenfeldii, Strain CCMP 1798" /LENGTH=400 /DNA_ID=CAMNT_0020611841 /DNA_START=156 /DNA_END=1358 /DNA_ORIENTATION=-